MSESRQLDLTDLSIEFLETTGSATSGLDLDGLSTSHGMTEAGASSIGPWGFVCSCCCCVSC